MLKLFGGGRKGKQQEAYKYERPILPKNLLLGEVVVNVLKFQAEINLFENIKKNTLLFTVPTELMVHSLKHRIHGITHIPVDRIRLLFCGACLEDDEYVPFDAFEVTKLTTEDADIFRPRCKFLFG